MRLLSTANAIKTANSNKLNEIMNDIDGFWCVQWRVTTCSIRSKKNSSRMADSVRSMVLFCSYSTLMQCTAIFIINTWDIKCMASVLWRHLLCISATASLSHDMMTIRSKAYSPCNICHYPPSPRLCSSYQSSMFRYIIVIIRTSEITSLWSSRIELDAIRDWNVPTVRHETQSGMPWNPLPTNLIRMIWENGAPIRTGSFYLRFFEAIKIGCRRYTGTLFRSLCVLLRRFIRLDHVRIPFRTCNWCAPATHEGHCGKIRDEQLGLGPGKKFLIHSITISIFRNFWLTS